MSLMKNKSIHQVLHNNLFLHFIIKMFLNIINKIKEVYRVIIPKICSQMPNYRSFNCYFIIIIIQFQVIYNHYFHYYLNLSLYHSRIIIYLFRPFLLFHEDYLILLFIHLMKYKD